MKINPQQTINFVNQYWDGTLIPALSEYISIPCKTTFYDPEWQQKGELKRAAELIVAFAKKQNIIGLKAEVVQKNNFAPLVFIEVAASSDSIKKTALLYGHFDKMPEAEGWSDGLAPWKPVLQDDKLYGRGAVDDGYAVFTYLAAIKVLQEQKISHGKFIFLIEGAEEADSAGFVEYMEQFRDRIGTPELVVVLDTDCKDYQRLWATTSARGLINGFLSIEILTAAEHSGGAGGIVPSPFRILRQVLSRIEDQENGKILLQSAKLEVPQYVIDAAKQTAAILGDEIYKNFHWVAGTHALSDDLVQLLLNNTWGYALEVTGAEGLPEFKDASNATRPMIKLKLSLRLPPRVDGGKIGAELKNALEKNSPYGAKINFSFESPPESGWEARGLDGSWLRKALDEASELFCKEKAAIIGSGGGIGTLLIMGNAFPKSIFLLTGCSGTGSNPHGPDECLYIPYAKKVTCSLAYIFAEFFNN